MAPPGKSRLFLDFLPTVPQNFRYLDAHESFSHAGTPDFSLDMVKRERLTLDQLARYDDILTDVLVDHVCVHFLQD